MPDGGRRRVTVPDGTAPEGTAQEGGRVRKGAGSEGVQYRWGACGFAASSASTSAWNFFSTKKDRNGTTPPRASRMSFRNGQRISVHSRKLEIRYTTYIQPCTISTATERLNPPSTPCGSASAKPRPKGWPVTAFVPPANRYWPNTYRATSSAHSRSSIPPV